MNSPLLPTSPFWSWEVKVSILLFYADLSLSKTNAVAGEPLQSFSSNCQETFQRGNVGGTVLPSELKHTCPSWDHTACSCSRVENSGLGFCFYWNWGRRPRVSRAHSLLVNLKCKGRNLKYGKKGLFRWLSGEESACRCRKHAFDPWSWKIPHAVDQLHHNY